MTWQWREPPRWLWVFAGVLLVWGATVLVTGGRGAGAIVTAAMAYGVFYVVVGIGQMVVITTGPGNIDLSIPSTMILAGYLAMGQMHGLDAGLVPGVALGLAVGFAVGVGNVVLIQLLRIPPIIATLAAGFVVQSAAIAYSRGSTAKPAPMLVDLMVARFAGIPALT
ncbi:MAG: ABC transporter permease, partial [Geminicoccaceae bacterium]